MLHHSINHENTPDQTLVPWPPWPNLTYQYCTDLPFSVATRGPPISNEHKLPSLLAAHNCTLQNESDVDDFHLDNLIST